MNRALENPASALEAREAASASGGTTAAKPRKSILRECAESVVIAVSVALLVRTFFVQAYMIPSGSMEPTLQIGDHILVSKMAYGLRVPDSIFGLRHGGLPLGRYLLHFGGIRRGDVVVFVPPQDRDTDFIKRVIGLPGDKVQVKNGRVWLNGKPMNDPHAHLEISEHQRLPDLPRDNFGFISEQGFISGPLEVPPGKLFVMGDNRDHSDDSRYWGFADEKDVEGRALAIYWSWDAEQTGLLSVRWSRLGMLINR